MSEENKTKTIRMYASTGMVGSKIIEEVEFDINASDGEIENYFEEWLHQVINSGFYEVNDNE